MRETGPTAKNLNDPAEGSPYVGVARTMLGSLKNDMRFNDLQQGVLKKDFPDGTRIIVESRFGQDKITILTEPPVLPQKPEQPPEEVQLPQVEEPPIPEIPAKTMASNLVICGTACTGPNDSTLYSYRPWVWRPGESEVTMIDVPGKRVGRAYAISGNGLVVVGSYGDDINDMRAFRWSALGGFQDLGDLGDSLTQGAATGVSYDGSVVVGYMRYGGGYIGNWVWTETEGMKRLEDTGGGMAKVSPSGQFIVANKLDTYEWTEYQYTAHGPSPVTLDGHTATLSSAAVWRRQGSSWAHISTLPLSGAVTKEHTAYFGTLPVTWSRPIGIIGHGITDTGTVVGIAWGLVRVPLGKAVEWLTDPGTTPDPPTNTNSSSTTPTGLLVRVCAGVTDDGNRSGGSIAISEQIDYGFIWTNGSGAVDSPSDHSGAIYTVAPDGNSAAGAGGGMHFIAGTDAGELRRDTPMYWDAGGPHEIPMPSGYVRAWADDSATPTVRIPPIPKAPVPFTLAD